MKSAGIAAASPDRYFWQMAAINHIRANKLPRGDFSPRASSAESGMGDNGETVEAWYGGIILSTAGK